MSEKPEIGEDAQRPSTAHCSASRCSALNAAVGNVIDQWDLLANDLKSDPGMESMDRAIWLLVKATQVT